jgi:hypothetical protein
MANWSKRRTTKAGNQGQRITRTTNTSGKSTYSSSKRVGNTRTTTSVSSTGKIKIYTTEHHPTLGVRRTTQTLNKQPRQKKPKKPRRSRNRTYDPNSNFNPFLPIVWWMSVPYSGWITAALILWLLSSAWYIWLIYFSAFLKLEVDYFK